MSPLSRIVRHQFSPSPTCSIRVGVLLLVISWSTLSLGDLNSEPLSDRLSHYVEESATWWSSPNWWQSSERKDDYLGSSFTVEEVEYVRRVLTYAFDIQHTPIGSIISSSGGKNGNDAHLMPATIAALVDRFRSIDINTLADQILAADEQLSTAMSLLKKINADRAAAHRGDGVLEASLTADDISTLIDWPWLPQANLSKCSTDYSQFVDPITNRIWEIVRSKLCEPVQPLCSLIIPPVPKVTMPSWGRRMIDAMGKIPDGLSEIRLHFVGSYDMCKSLEIEYNLTVAGHGSELRQFNGQYCRINIQPSFSGLNLTDVEVPIALLLGVCTPDTCSRSGVANYITKDNKALAAILFAVFDNATIPKVYCDQEVDSSTDIALQAAVGIMLACVILIIVSTIYDGCVRKRKLKKFLKTLPIPKDISHHTSNADGDTSTSSCSCSTGKSGSPDCSVSNKVEKDGVERVCSYELVKNIRHLGLNHRMELFLLGFSAYTNLRKIFSTRSRPDHLPVLNGLRYLSYVWTILGQSYFLGPVYHECIVTSNSFSMLRTFPREFKMQAVINFHISSDTFLLISGILVTYWFLKRFEAGGKQLKIVTFIIYGVRRYWRVMPGLMLTLMFYTTTYRYLAEGPMFPANISDGDNCRLNWWVDLLMVQNLVRTEHLCLSWLFTVAIILQLQIAAIFVLVPLALKPIFGYIMVGVMWVAHIITTAILTHDFRTNGDISDLAMGYLFTPWCRAGPFVIGLALGIILHKIPKVKMHLAVNLVGWLVALCTMGAVVFSSYSQFMEGGERWSDSALAAYDTLARSAWGIAVGWVVFACHYGYGGVINTFFSWRLFWPLSRLVYASLLTHAIMVLRFLYTNRQLLYIEQYHMLYLILGNLAYTAFMGIVFGLLFHYPMSMGIERTVLSRNMTDFLRAGRHPRSIKRSKLNDSDGELHKSPPPATATFAESSDFGDVSKTYEPLAEDISPAPTYSSSTAPPLAFEVDNEQLKF